MKKLFLFTFLVVLIVAISSCSYDDSNDIDVITPNDSTTTAIHKIN